MVDSETGTWPKRHRTGRWIATAALVVMSVGTVYKVRSHPARPVRSGPPRLSQLYIADASRKPRIFEAEQVPIGLPGSEYVRNDVHRYDAPHDLPARVPGKYSLAHIIADMYVKTADDLSIDIAEKILDPRDRSNSGVRQSVMREFRQRMECFADSNLGDMTKDGVVDIEDFAFVLHQGRMALGYTQRLAQSRECAKYRSNAQKYVGPWPPERCWWFPEGCYAPLPREELKFIDQLAYNISQVLPNGIRVKVGSGK